ncbi:MULTISPECIES: DUF4113 domain-containing protein [Pseudomonas]|uniref:DUF4113 domain-containing protein n=1 Tax=Pseudomonas TaxID=286 RepID=UPI000A76DD95|nr:MULTISPECIES: DUF4113 domain-containing protein [Pseudomonas]
MNTTNRRLGNGMSWPARITAEPGWAMRRELMSQSYTPGWISFGRCVVERVASTGE